MRSLPLTERKARLKKLLRKADGLNYVDHVQGDGPRVFDHACRMGLEGIISKLANSTYPEGATRNWLKVKKSALRASAYELASSHRLIRPPVVARAVT